MGIITDILSEVDDAIETVARSGFVTMADSIGDFVTIGATVSLMLIAANAVLQVRPMSMGTLVSYALKVALIGLFALSWSNFEVVYRIVTDVPESIGEGILTLTTLSDTSGLYDALDGMLARMTEYGDVVGGSAPWYAGAIVVAIFYVIAAAFAAVAAGIIAYAKIMLVIMIVIAPFAITASMFRATHSLFEAWTRALSGYAVMPIAAAAAVGVVVAIGDSMAARLDPADVTEISVILPFLAVLLLSIGIMAAVPAIAANLSGAFHLASNAQGLDRFLRAGMMRAPNEAGAVIRQARLHMGDLGRDGSARIERIKRAGDGPTFTPGEQLARRDRVRGVSTGTGLPTAAVRSVLPGVSPAANAPKGPGK